MRRGFLTAMFIAAVLYPISVQHATAQSLPVAHSSRVPLEVLESGHIALSATLNGKGPFRFILDTGSPITFVDVDTALAAGLIKGIKPTTTPSLLPVSMTSAGTIKVGSEEVSNVAVMVLNHPVISLLSQIEGPLHGILGFSFWARFNLILDYADGTITLSPGHFHPPDVVSRLMSRLFGSTTVKHLVPAAQWGASVTKPVGQKRGVTVTSVYAGTPAAEAGLQPGDVLLSVDGRWTDTLDDCWNALSMEKPGKPVEVTILRGAKRMHIMVTPAPGI